MPTQKQGDYSDLISLVARREFGVVGPEKTLAVMEANGVKLDAEGNVLSLAGDAQHILNQVLVDFGARYGLWTILGCKIAVMKAAREWGLPLPEVLQRH